VTVRGATIVGFILGPIVASVPKFSALSNVMEEAFTIGAFVLFIFNWKMKGEWGGLVGGFLLGLALGGIVFRAAPISIRPQ